MERQYWKICVSKSGDDVISALALALIFKTLKTINNWWDMLLKMKCHHALLPLYLISPFMGFSEETLS